MRNPAELVSGVTALVQAGALHRRLAISSRLTKN